MSGAVDCSCIRVKAMLIVPSDDGTRHLVSLNAPSTETPQGFHRLIGGSVEFGETHRDAIIREVHEELNAEIRDLRYLGVVENIFTFDDEPGHEVVALYRGRLVPAPGPEGGTLTESDGSVVPVVRRPFAEDGVVEPLHPTSA